MRYKGGSFKADVIFHFSITYRSLPFYLPRYSQYQYFLYDTIIEHRESGKTFNQIAEWLNEKGYLSVRGKKFGGAHAHSIVKKKRLKERNKQILIAKKRGMYNRFIKQTVADYE